MLFGSLNCQLLENGGNGVTARGCQLGGGVDFLPPLTESTGRSVPSSQERWRWGVHTHHPHESGIDKKGEAEWRCQAGVLRGADFVGSLGPMWRRSCSCESPGLAIPGCSRSPFLLRANSFVRPPRKPASPPGPWRLYSRHRCLHRPGPTERASERARAAPTGGRPRPFPRPRRPSWVCPPAPRRGRRLAPARAAFSDNQNSSAHSGHRRRGLEPPASASQPGRKRRASEKRPGAVPGRCTG